MGTIQKLPTIFREYGELGIDQESLLSLAERDNSFWVKLNSGSGSVEGKLHLPDQKTTRLIIFEPGCPGSGSGDFEKGYLKGLLKGGYAVFTVRHNGTKLNGKHISSYINCPEREKAAREVQEEILGGHPPYSIGDWLKEPMIAVDALVDAFSEIIMIGHSFGALAVFYSLSKLSKECQSAQISKIKRVVSLAGDVGKIRTPDPVVLKVWREYLDSDSICEVVEIGDTSKNLDHIRDAYYAIHEEGKLIPSQIQLVCVNPWGDSPDSVDEFISPQDALDMILTLGHGTLIIDKTQKSDPKIGQQVHDMSALKTDMLLKFIDLSWNPDKEIAREFEESIERSAANL